MVNIPNAFIQTRMEDEKDMAFIKIWGVLVDILVDIAPEICKPYAHKDKKGIKQLLVQCQNAICSTMVARMLCCQKFTQSLERMGFKMNPCNPCVANKMIDGEQMMMCFHVDVQA